MSRHQRPENLPEMPKRIFTKPYAVMRKWMKQHWPSIPGQGYCRERPGAALAAGGISMGPSHNGSQ